LAVVVVVVVLLFHSLLRLALLLLPHMEVRVLLAEALIKSLLHQVE
jgi:hypothetical protein